jgi:putative transposase
MGIARFEKGATVNVDGRRYQILHKLDDGTWQFSDLRTGQFVDLSESEVLRKIADETLTFPGAGTIAQCGPANATLSEKDHETAKIRFAYVREALTVPNTRSALDRTIAEVWEKLKAPPTPPSFSRVYAWKRRYKASGKDIRSLVDNNSAKGNRSARYSAEVLAICQQAIEARYMRRERSTIQDTIENAMLRTKDRNATLPQSLALPMPTRRLVKRLVAQIPAIEKHTARYGREAARQLFRSVKGHVVTSAPLERAEIDHTILDIFVIDERTSMPLGRPCFTACIEDYTRCILGINLSFTPPSFNTVAKCLKDSFLPKVRLREEYPQVTSEWLAHGVMTELVLDNGLDFHSRSLEQVCGSLGITMRYAARKEAWFKGKIERFFGTFNRSVAHVNPGTTFSNIFDKGDYDPVKHSVITLLTLQTIVRKWIADVYHQQYHAGIETSPAQMWENSIRLEDIRLPDDTTNLDAIMGRSHERTLTHKGIEFEGLFYNSADLEEWRRSQGPKIKAEIRVDESDLGSIYVLSPKISKPYKVPCLNTQYASRLSLWQHQLSKRWRAQNASTARNEDGWMEAKRAIQQIVEESMSSGVRRSGKRLGRYLQDSGRTSAKSRQASIPNTLPQLRGSSDAISLEQAHFAAIEDQLSESYVIPKASTDIPRLTPIYRKGYFVD